MTLWDPTFRAGSAEPGPRAVRIHGSDSTVLSMSRFVVLAATVAAVGGSLFGYDTGVISGAILFIRPSFGLSTGEVELVVSAVLIGATIGAIGSARLTDALGRRVVLLAAAISFGVGAIASALAPGLTVLGAARLLVGLAIGVASYAVPLYISELAPPSSRGWLVLLNQLAITIGILASYGLLTVVALIFVYMLVPETKGRTLEQIEGFWHSPRAVACGLCARLYSHPRRETE
jgi:MFS family permease